jgi:hypothetical protein
MFKGQTAPDGELRHSSASAFEIRHELQTYADVKDGFTRRCGRRAPADKRPCMYVFAHGGLHEWELAGADAPQ